MHESRSTCTPPSPQGSRGFGCIISRSSRWPCGAARSTWACGARIALAWRLQRSPVMLPIPGTLRVAHVEGGVAAASPSLTPEEIAVLDAAVLKYGCELSEVSRANDRSCRTH